MRGSRPDARSTRAQRVVAADGHAVAATSKQTSREHLADRFRRFPAAHLPERTGRG